jgi:hypothetical protein
VKTLSLLLVAGVSVLAALAIADTLRSGEGSSASTASTATESGSSTSATNPPRLSADEEIERIGNSWASLVARGNASSCFWMTQPACERIECVGVGDSELPNCIPLTRAFIRSFEGATVQEIMIRGHRAAARFSNGEMVEFWGDAATWLVSEVGGNAGAGSSNSSTRDDATCYAARAHRTSTSAARSSLLRRLRSSARAAAPAGSAGWPRARRARPSSREARRSWRRGRSGHASGLQLEAPRIRRGASAECPIA